MGESLQKFPMRKWLIRILFCFIVVELIYILAGNIMLSTGVLKNILNRRPEKLVVNWTAAYTVFPGRVTVRGFEIHNRTIRTDWEVRLARATFNMTLTALLRRTFHVTGLEGSGGEFQLKLIPREPFPEPGGISDTKGALRLRSGRPLGSLSSVKSKDSGRPLGSLSSVKSKESGRPLGSLSSVKSKDSGRPSGAQSDDESRPRWLIHLKNVSIRDITGIRIAEYALVTRGRIRGNMRYLTRSTMQVYDTEVTLENGDLQFRNRAVGTDLNIICREVELGPYIPRDYRGIKSCEFLSGELLLEGEITTVDFLDYYFRDMPWLRIDGSGEISTHLKLNRGTFTDSSRLDLESDTFTAQLRDITVRGNGILHGRITGFGLDSETRFNLDLKDIAVDKPDRFKSPIQGPSLHVETRSGPFRLEKSLPEIAVTVEIPDTEIPDLSIYNDLFPESSGFRILPDSAGRVGARLDIAGNRGECRLVIDGGDIGFRMRDRSMRGQMRLDARISSDDPNLRRFDIPEMEIHVTDLHRAGTRADTPDWAMNLVFRDAIMELNRPMILDGHAQLTVTDSSALAGLFTRTDGRWFHEYLIFHNVRGTGRFNMDGEAMKLVNLAITGEGTLPQHLNIGQLQVGVNCASLDFREGWQNLSLNFELPETPINDLSVFNGYIPDSSGFSFKPFSSGRAKLKLDIKDGSAEGLFSLDCRSAHFSFHDQPFTGDITLKIHLKNPRIDSRIFDISGSHLMFAGTGSKEPMIAPWWGSLRISRGTVEVTRPLDLHAETEIRMQDTRPVIALFQEKKKWVKIFRDLLEIDDIQGTANVKLQSGLTRIDDLNLTGERLEIRSHLRLMKNDTVGIFYARLRGFAVGVELKDGQRDPRFLRPRKWFEEYSWPSRR